MNMHSDQEIQKEHGCQLGIDPVISKRAVVRTSQLGKYTEIAEDVKLTETNLGDYSYVMERSEIIYADIGKFVNVASDVRINPGNHPMEWVSQHHFLYRMKQYGFGDNDNEDFFAWRKMQTVESPQFHALQLSILKKMVLIQSL